MLEIDDSPALDDLDFSDLYLRIDEKCEARYKPFEIGPQAPGNLPVPEEFTEELERVRSYISTSTSDEGSFTHNEMRLRFSRQVLSGTEVWASVRRIPLYPPNITDLNLDPKLVEILKGWSGKRGLIAIGGATGVGKTTTAISILHEYLRTRGGLGYTVEDPPEYLMTGPFGKNGFCFQVEITDDSQWGHAMKNAMRWRPRYILMGEIRTAEAARHLLRAATSGHLVMTTTHGGNISETIQAILQTAQIEIGKMANSLLANGLLAVMHQTMTRNGPIIRLLDTSQNPANSAKIRTAIAKENYSTLNEYTETFGVVK